MASSEKSYIASMIKKTLCSLFYQAAIQYISFREHKTKK